MLLAENFLPVMFDEKFRLWSKSGQVLQLEELQLRACPVDLLRPPAKDDRRPPTALAPSMTPSEDCWAVRFCVEVLLGGRALGEATLPKDCLERALERVIIIHNI